MSTNLVQIVGVERLRAMSALTDGSGLLFLAGHVAVLIAGGVLIWSALGTFWLVPAMIAHGIVIAHLFAPQHECGHNTAFRTRWLNDAVGYATGLLILIPYRYFKLEHSAHHRFTQLAGQDPEMISHNDRVPAILWYATAIPYWRGVVGVLVRVAFGRFLASELAFIPKSHRRRVQREVWVFWAIYGAGAAASLALQSAALLIYWFLPLLIGQWSQRLIRMSEHGGCEKSLDFFRNTRTTQCSLPLRWLGWNMAFHAEHHFATLVPFHRLPEAHRALQGRFAHLSPGYRHALGEVLARARAGAAA